MKINKKLGLPVWLIKVARHADSIGFFTTNKIIQQPKEAAVAIKASGLLNWNMQLHPALISMTDKRQHTISHFMWHLYHEFGVTAKLNKDIIEYSIGGENVRTKVTSLGKLSLLSGCEEVFNDTIDTFCSKGIELDLVEKLNQAINVHIGQQ